MASGLALGVDLGSLYMRAVVIDRTLGRVVASLRQPHEDKSPPGVVKALCDRQFGVGGDGVLRSHGCVLRHKKPKHPGQDKHAAIYARYQSLKDKPKQQI